MSHRSSVASVGLSLSLVLGAGIPMPTAAQTDAETDEGEAGLPLVEPVSCGEVFPDDEAEAAIAVWERVADGRASSTIGRTGGETCTLSIAEEEATFVRLEPGDPSDFEPAAELEYGRGETVPGFGDEARLFHAGDVEGTGRTTMAVRERRDLGDLRVRITLGRPDLGPADRGLIVARLMRDALPRFPGVARPERDSTPLDVEPPDMSDMSLVANLVAREQDGDWTRGEGLVATLALLAGEVDADAVLHTGSIEDWEGTGILSMAARFIEQERDDPSWAEVARLHDQLTLTADELETMAGLDGKAAAGRLVATGPRTAQTLEDLCTNHGWPFGDGSHCLKLWELDAPAGYEGRYRVFLPVDSVGSGWTPAHHIDTIAAVTRSAAWFETVGRPMMASAGGPGRMIDVDVVFRSGGPGDAYSWAKDAYAWTDLRRSDSCTVSLFTGAQALPPDHFAQVIGHELAHCFQWANLRPQYAAGRASYEWWVEGTAEYLSHLIYPKADFEWRFEPRSYDLAVGASLMDLSYASFLFWHGIARQLGPSGIFQLLLTLPTSGGKDAQAAALAAYDGMDVRFQLFVERMTDRMIVDPGSGRKNTGPSFPDLVLFNESKDLFRLRPFSAVERRVRVIDCKIADLDLELGDAIQGARIMTDLGNWDVLPPQLGRGPYEGIRILALTAPKAQVVTLSVTKMEDDPDPECEVDTDRPPDLELCGCESRFFGRIELPG